MMRALLLFVALAASAQTLVVGTSRAGYLPVLDADPDCSTVGMQYFNSTVKAVRTCVNVSPATWSSGVATAEPAETGPQVLTPLDATALLYDWWAYTGPTATGFTFSPGDKTQINDGAAYVARFQSSSTVTTGSIRQPRTAFRSPFQLNTWYRLDYTIGDMRKVGVGVACQVGLYAAQDANGFLPWFPVSEGPHRFYFLSTSNPDLIGVGTSFQVGCYLNGADANGTSFTLSRIALTPVAGPDVNNLRLCGDPGVAGAALVWDAARSCYTAGGL